MNSIKLITFDITGTLLRVRLSVGEQYAEALKNVPNISCDPNKITKSFHSIFKCHDEAFPIFGQNAGLTTKFWWKSVFLSTLIASNTLNPSQHGISKLSNSSQLWQLEERTSPISKAFDCLYNNFEYDVIPHAHQLLDFLKQNFSVTLGIISNSDERIETALKKAGLDMYFDFVVSSPTCGFKKPDKQIFDYALKMAEQQLFMKNPLPPSSALHVGDKMKEDYRGAIDAGFNAVILDPKDKFVDIVDPAHLAKDLTVIQQKLEQILPSR